MILKLIKTGSFVAHQVGDVNHKCGMPEILEFKYAVSITATSNCLSPEGFVIENTRIQSYFDSAYAGDQKVKSCELIAMHSATELGQLMLKEGITVKSVVVTIHGSPTARIMAEWVAPKIKHSKPAAAKIEDVVVPLGKQHKTPQAHVRDLIRTTKQALEAAKKL